jgi:phosphohistidine phosphatase
MQVLLARHAKSAYPDGVADHDRPLSSRGVADAEAVSEHLGRMVVIPSRVVASTATRTAQTARILAAAASPPASVEYLSALYGAGVADVIAVARSVGDDVLIVGHQPTLSMTVEALCGAAVSMVTTAVAAIEVSGFDVTQRRTGILRWLITPRLVRGVRE